MRCIHTDGTPDQPNQKIQDVTAIELRIDGQSINIPLQNAAIKAKAEAIITSSGHEVWWPGTSRTGNDFCTGGLCQGQGQSRAKRTNDLQYLVTIAQNPSLGGLIRTMLIRVSLVLQQESLKKTAVHSMI